MALCNPHQQWFDLNGKPLAGGRLYAYLAGTTTPTTTWQDAGLGILNTNPVILDGFGFSTVWLNPTAVYKFRMTDHWGVQQWTQDNVSGNLLCAPSGPPGPLPPAGVEVSSVSVVPQAVQGGVSNSTGTVTLNVAAPAGGAVVSLSSSDTSVATVPATVTVPAGSTTATFTVTTYAVVGDTGVSISAGIAGVGQSATLTVMAPGVPSLSTLTLSPTTVQGGSANSTGTVHLTAPAYTGGMTINLYSSDPSVSVPLSVTVPAGATQATFTLTTSVVGTQTVVTITADHAGTQATANLTLTAAPVVQAIYGGLGAATDATGVTTISGGLVVLVPYTGDVLSVLQNTAETVGQSFGPFNPTDQAIYLLLVGGSHTFLDQNSNTFAMNPPTQTTLNGRTMYLYSSTNLLYLTWTIKIAS